MTDSPTLTIAHAKLVDYLLNLDHPVGGWKAKFFLKHGFRGDDPEELASSLIRHAVAGWLGFVSPSSRAMMNVIAGPLLNPLGTAPQVSAVWHVSDASGDARFITAYPR